MSQSFNSKNISNNQKIQISQSIMSFNDYYFTFVGIKETHLANDWGWFIDIDLNTEPIRVPLNNYVRNKPSQHISDLNTIKEYPSIRSMKSMKNLHDTSMIFEMDDDDNKHRTNKNFCSLITHCVEIITILLVYVLVK